MARVLIAWEMGEAFGHLVRCLRLAEGLRDRGHSITLVLKDLRLPGGQGVSPGIAVLPAPSTPHAVAGRIAPVNYADMLLTCGFSEPKDVAARVRAWDDLYALVRPDVLVADHAPTALLAAEGAGIPHLAIGNGFAIPPAASPWPSMRPWEGVAHERLLAAESRLDRVVKAAWHQVSRRHSPQMRELFGSCDVLDTFSELDHYDGREGGNYVGPIVSVPTGLRATWQSRERAKVLAYLRPEVPGFAEIMNALSRLDAEVLCVAPGLAPEAARRLATSSLRIALTPLVLPPLLERADLAVGYANGGFSTQALLAGVPLLLRPKHVEQALLARRVKALGAGKILIGHVSVADVLASLHELLFNPAYRQAAGVFQERHRYFSPVRAVEESLCFIERALLAGRHAVRTAQSTEQQESYPACLH